MYEVKKSNESFVRWQGRSIEQLGKSLNLYFSWAIGVLAFQVHLFISSEFKGYRESFKALFVISVIMITLSVISGAYFRIIGLETFV